jgi:2-haloacid dehalogenase
MTTRWVSFDCYGTLVDWRTGMLTVFAALCPGRADELLGRYHEHEHRIESRQPFPSYREVLMDTLAAAAADLGIVLDREQTSRLPESIADWPVFPDVVPALSALASDGYRLAVLSNVDDDLVAGTLPQLSVPIDEVVTAQQVRSYKPGTAHFTTFRRRTGVELTDWTHVAGSYFFDIEPAHAAGIANVFVNRDGETGEFLGADEIVADLVPLPRRLGRPAP